MARRLRSGYALNVIVKERRIGWYCDFEMNGILHRFALSAGFRRSSNDNTES